MVQDVKGLGRLFISTQRVRYAQSARVSMWLKTSAMPGYWGTLSTIISRKYASSTNYPFNASNQHYHYAY
jgi:hypothetical protein